MSWTYQQQAEDEMWQAAAASEPRQTRTVYTLTDTRTGTELSRFDTLRAAQQARGGYERRRRAVNLNFVTER
jgi:hypothetical protein